MPDGDRVSNSSLFWTLSGFSHFSILSAPDKLSECFLGEQTDLRHSCGGLRPSLASITHAYAETWPKTYHHHGEVWTCCLQGKELKGAFPEVKPEYLVWKKKRGLAQKQSNIRRLLFMFVCLQYVKEEFKCYLFTQLFSSIKFSFNGFIKLVQEFWFLLLS